MCQENCKLKNLSLEKSIFLRQIQIYLFESNRRQNERCPTKNGIQDQIRTAKHGEGSAMVWRVFLHKDSAHLRQSIRLCTQFGKKVYKHMLKKQCHRNGYFSGIMVLNRNRISHKIALFTFLQEAWGKIPTACIILIINVTFFVPLFLLKNILKNQLK